MSDLSKRYYGLLLRRDLYSRKNDTEFYSYSYYRKNHHPEIAEDCQHRCIYCGLHESEFGGIGFMQIDHFRPWSKENFSHLKDDPSNFVHSCSKCNYVKKAKWPSTDEKASHDGVVGFIDPFEEARSDYLALSDDGSIASKKKVGEYLIRLFNLDSKRLQLSRLRDLKREQLRKLVAEKKRYWEAVASGEADAAKDELAADLVRFANIFLILDS